MDSPVLSVLLPTIRPEQFRRSYDSIKAAAGTLPYEVIVVADFPRAVEDKNCLWLKRPRYGPTDATMHACEAALGTYVFAMNDEAVLDAGALQALYREAVKEPWVLLTPLHLPHFNFVYYGLPFAPFPFAHVGVLSRLGDLFDRAYGAFYADPDLSMRAHAGGVPVRVVEDAILRHDNNMHAIGHQENLSLFYARDQATFRSRWDHLGEFKDPS